MNKTERDKLRIIFAEALTYSNFAKAQELLDYVDTLEVVLNPFALAAEEADKFHFKGHPSELWLWKPQSNKVELSGINKAHLNAAREALAEEK